MDTEDGYMVEQLEELMRSLTMVHDMEDACPEGWSYSPAKDYFSD